MEPPIEPSTTRICALCGAVVPPSAPQGLCPKCLMEGAAVPTEAGLPAGGPPTPIPSLERVAAAFPHLEVKELIGAGGMGAVFKCRQPHLERWVALKVLPESLAARPEFAERFQREARMLARLNHPNIVTLYDFGVADGLGFLLMEYVDGVNLRQAMRAGRFTPSEALALVPRICEALQFAHDEGILHRDIKPENILLDRRGRLKIADFGIARLAGDAGLEPALTGSGSTLGTPAYMAPEQIENPASVDHRADIYSLGVVLYELLTGELPLGRFVPPSAKTPLDDRIDAIVLRALAKERASRQQSATELRTEVEGVSGSNAAPRPAPPPPLSAASVIGQEPLPTARGATLSAILGVGSALVAMGVLLVVFYLSLARHPYNTTVGLAPPEVSVEGGGVRVGLGWETHRTSSMRHSAGRLRVAPVWLGMTPLVVFCLPTAMVGALVGAGALREIRAANGQRRGLSRALFGTMTWPCLVVAGGVGLAIGLSQPLGADSLQKVVLAALVVGAPLGMLLPYAAWRWAHGVGRPSGGYAVLAISWCLLAPPALLASALGHRIGAIRSALQVRQHQATAQVTLDAGFPAEARVRFWTNGVPVELPDLTFPVTADPNGFAWFKLRLRPGMDGDWILSASGIGETPLGRQPARLRFGKNRALAASRHTHIVVDPTRAQRWWPFLSPDEFPRGLDPDARAEWGVSVDIGVPTPSSTLNPPGNAEP